MEVIDDKIWLIEQITKIQDHRLLKALRNLTEFGVEADQKPAVDFWDELTDYQKDRVEKAIQSLRQGKGKPHVEVFERFKQKYA